MRAQIKSTKANHMIKINSWKSRAHILSVRTIDRALNTVNVHVVTNTVKIQ